MCNKILDNEFYYPSTQEVANKKAKLVGIYTRAVNYL